MDDSDDLGLAAYGLEEVDTDTVLDTFENRAVLRALKYQWQTVYDDEGQPTPYIRALNPEAVKAQALRQIENRKMLLVDTRDVDSDYETGTSLLLITDVQIMIPKWVYYGTLEWIRVNRQRETNPGKSIQPALVAAPARCVARKKSDGLRCMNWTNGRTVSGLCKTHTGSPQAISSVEQARVRLHQAAGSAVEQLEALMTAAESEPVRLNAARDILDRAGVRAGFEVETTVEVHHTADAEIRKRLEKLRSSAEHVAEATATTASAEDTEETVIEGEVVEDE